MQSAFNSYDYRINIFKCMVSRIKYWFGENTPTKKSKGIKNVERNEKA